MGLKEKICSIGSRLRPGAETTARPIQIQDKQHLEKCLDAIVARFPGDHRVLTYGTSLFQLPPSAFSDTRRILEVGMSDNLLKFREVFGRDVECFGITLDKSHRDVAKALAYKEKVKVDVRLRDIKDGLPKGFDNMDLAMDIFSASHYADTNETIRILAESLRSGGHLIVVPGGLIAGMQDYIREHPEDQSFHLRFRYTRGEEPLAQIYLNYDIKGKKDTLQAAISRIVKDLKEVGYNLSDDPQEDDVIACFEDMVLTLRVNVVTNYDLLDLNRRRVMESVGLTNIRRFATSDGDGWIARKQ